VNPKRPKSRINSQPDSLRWRILEEAAELAGELKIERPYSLQEFCSALRRSRGRFDYARPGMLAHFNRAVWEFYAHRKAVPCSLQTVKSLSDLREIPRKGVTSDSSPDCQTAADYTRSVGTDILRQRSLTSAGSSQACEADGTEEGRRFSSCHVRVPPCPSQMPYPHLGCASKTRRPITAPIRCCSTSRATLGESFRSKYQQSKWTVSRQSMYVQLPQVRVGRPIFIRMAA